MCLSGANVLHSCVLLTLCFCPILFKTSWSWDLLFLSCTQALLWLNAPVLPVSLLVGCLMAKALIYGAGSGFGWCFTGCWWEGKSFTGESGEVPMGACLTKVQVLPARQFPFFPPKQVREQPWTPLEGCVCHVRFNPVKWWSLFMECWVPINFSGSLWCLALNGRTWERLSTRFVCALLTYQQSTCICNWVGTLLG